MWKNIRFPLFRTGSQPHSKKKSENRGLASLDWNCCKCREPHSSCRSWEFRSSGLDRSAPACFCLSSSVCKVLVTHWPNLFVFCLGSETSAYRKIQHSQYKQWAIDKRKADWESGMGAKGWEQMVAKGASGRRLGILAGRNTSSMASSRSTYTHIWKQRGKGRGFRRPWARQSVRRV